MDSYSPGLPLSSNGSPSTESSQISQTIGMDAPASDKQSPDTTASSTNSETRPAQNSVSAACLGCRSKHLKCDGKTPCVRCFDSNSECVYIASRRGYKGSRRGTAQNPNKRHASSSPDGLGAGDSCPMLLGAVGPGTSAHIPPSMNVFNPVVGLPGNTPPTPYDTTPHLANLQVYRSPGNGTMLNSLDVSGLYLPTASAIPPRVPMQTTADRCFDSFYENFHAAHPFVLPKPYLLRLARENTFKHLLAAIRYIGSLYLDVGPAKATYFDEAYQLAYEPSTLKDGYLVQTLLLLIIGLDGSCQRERAAQLLGDAERIAHDIALNTRPFAQVNGRGIPVLEESWRRTWWDLYVCDGMIAGVHQMTKFELFDVPSDVGLPCEESEYLSGQIPLPMSLVDLEDRDFSGDDREFSSFAYRILAARTLGKFMRTPKITGPNDDNLARIENLLTNWRMHIPPTKKDALNKDCQLDEMMFQAHMMTHATSLLLHQPHSQLDSSPARSVTSCAPHREVLQNDVFNIHTRHTISSANEITKMITHRVPLLSHTHFFTCVVTLSSIVHLSKWALSFIPHDDDDLRQQIRLNIGALRQLADVWKAANTASDQVKSVAQGIFREKKAAQATNPAYWLGLTQEEMARTIVADEIIIKEIETMATLPNIAT